MRTPSHSNDRSWKLTILLTVGLLVKAMTGQAQTPTVGMTGSTCVGGTAFFYFTGSCTPSWTPPSNGTIIANNGMNINVQWTSAGSATVFASGSCGSASKNTTISTSVTPTASLSLSTSNSCQGSPITLTASGTNGGTPFYNFYIDGASVQSGTSATYSTSGLSAGSHSAYVIMTSSIQCVTGSATSSTQNFTVTAKASYTVTLNGPSIICSTNMSAPVHATVFNAVGNLTYQWSGAGAGTTSVPDYTFPSVSNGNTLLCTVYSDNWCVNSPVASNTYTVNITNAVTPSVQPQVTFLTYCSGATINLSPSLTNISGSPTYSWKLNGNQFATTASTSLVASYTNVFGYYYPGSSITVDVTGISGTCLTSTSAFGSAPALTINAPTVAGTLGSITSSFCSSGSVTLSVTGNTGTITRYMVRTQDNGGSWTAWSNTTATPSVTTTAGINRTYNFQTFVQNGTCLEVGTNIVSTTVYATPTIGTLSSTNGTNFCGSGTINLSLSGYTGTLGWYYQINDGSGWGAWTQFGTPNSLTNSLGLSTNGSANRTYQFYGQVQNGVCSTINSNTLVVFVGAVPTASAPANTSLFSSQSTNIAITNPIYVSGTVNSWTVSQVNVTGATNSSGNTIAQALSTTSTTGTANYTITPATSYCAGTPVVAAVNVYPFPIIVVAPQTYIVKGANVTMDVGSGYDTYSWRNSANAQVATTQTYSTSVPDTYTVTVTKSGATASPSVILKAQLAGVNQNYVISNTSMISNLTDASSINNFPVDQVNQNIQYIDGLGRPIQTVATQSSPLKNDIVSPIFYDANGREFRKYLPFVSQNNGWYKSGVIDGVGNVIGVASSFYSNGTADKIVDDSRPFTETIFETSPLNRPSQDYGPGKDWGPVIGGGNNKYVYHQYLVNNSSVELVIAWDVSTGVPVRSTVSNTNISGGYYSTGQLSIKSTKDEQGNEVREYADKLGHTILKKVQAVGGSPSLTDVNSWTQTYYVYDDLGLLRYVLQPELTKAFVNSGGNPIQADLDKFAFQYQYDARNRMIQKQVPGSGAVYMVYDNHDRLVMTQDANQRPNKQWTLTKYDVLNRPIITGIYTHNAIVDQVTMTGLISTINFYETYNGVPATHGYTTNVWPMSGYTVLTVSYYDNYNFVNNLALGTDFNYATGEISGQEPLSNTAVVGHPTGGKINVLGTTSFLYSVNYYDSKYRTIQTIAQNNKGGWDRTTQVVDFTGKALNTKTRHHTSSHTDLMVTRRFQYDHVGRLLRTFHQVNSNPEFLLSQNTYNEIGQLVRKDLHCTNCNDPAANQSTTAPGGAIVRSVYNSNEQTLLATQSILLEPGYFVPNGSTVDAKVVSSNATIPGGGSGGTYMQSVDYRYNIRGWLQSVNNSQLTNDSGITNGDTNDLFGFELAYNAPFATGSTGNSLPYQYNGNITSMKWSSNHGNFITGFGSEVAYNYGYDAVNRISDATYLSKTNGAWATDVFNETGYAYDLNGNIQSLKRKSTTASPMDNMTYTYNGNQLLSVTDAGDKTKGFIDGANTGNDYHYDLNGNMDHDLNKGLGTTTTDVTHNISYNYLNLPAQAIKNTNEKIIYTYDASGRKLMQQVYNAAGAVTKATDYNGEFIYQGDTLQFINHEEGRIVMKGVTNPEYQYHLKDHLGNVRLTFTSQMTTKKFKAGFEVADQTTEASNFTNYQTNKINTLTPTNPNATTGNSAFYLNGGYAGQVGLAKSLSVMPGDVVNIQASAKYSTPSTTPTNFTPFIGSLLAAFNLAAPAAGEVGTPAAGVNTFGNWEIGAAGDESKGDAMKIFVTIILFDRNYNFLDVSYDAIHSSGSMNATYIAKQPGYAYIYISNEHPYLTDVYFDDVAITFTPSPVVQQEDFYPFGLTFNSYTRENSLLNKYQYNGKELQNDLSLNWLDYGARMYMPEIGRWGVRDPKAELLEMSSPYVYSLNNPINFVDKDGELPIFINGKTMENSQRGDESYWDYQLLRTIASSGIPNPGGEVHYVDGNRGWEVSVVDGRKTNIPSTQNATFVMDRVRGGYLEGKRDFKNILAKLARDPKTGKITEKIQIYTHSRGAAFGTGYTTALLEMIKENEKEFADSKNVIDFVLNMGPHQSDFLTAPEGVDSYSIDHSRDKLSDNDMSGLKAAFTSNEKSSGFFGGHSITSFAKDVGGFLKSFQQSKGDSKLATSIFIWTMQNQYGIKVTVK
jgi:RHS repeat-associated protein